MRVPVLLLLFLPSTLTLDIGIIGGGISGTSAAYFLSNLFESKPSIDLYESNVIGGRLATVKIGNRDEYEVGGSVLHASNKYVSDLMEAMNLTKLNNDKHDFIALYDGKEFPFFGSPYRLIDASKLLWRYGFELYSLNENISSLVQLFTRIYAMQNGTKSYSTAQELLKAIDNKLSKYLEISTRDGFKNDGFSDRVIDEMVTAALLCNYGDTAAVNKFVGSVSFAGAGGNLFSVKDGNKLLPKKLLEASKATFINKKVEKIGTNKGGKLSITAGGASKKYDIVIVATPITKDQENQIEFVNFKNKIFVPGNYHKTVRTIVEGKVNMKYFGLSEGGYVPGDIFAIKDDLLFRTISKIYPTSGEVKDDKEVYSIFSSRVLTRQEIKQLFTSFSFIKSVEWLAYPKYGIEPRSDKFELDKNLYHINSMEWTSSSIETSIIGARNVVNLIAKNSKLLTKTQNGNPEINHSEL